MDLFRLLSFFVITSLLTALIAGCGDDDNRGTEHDENNQSSCEPAPVDGGWAEAMSELEEGALMSVWGPHPKRVYAVGGQPHDGIAFVRKDQSWESVDIPQGAMLNWVHGVDNEVWMVGNEGRALRSVGGRDFESWDTGVDDDLWGVWAAAVDDVWAVGGDARDFDAEPVILHFDGENWTSVQLPSLDRSSNALFKVWGTGPDHVFAVGALGVILHFDGASWSQMASGTGEDFVSLWGRAGDEIVAVGGRSNGMVARYDGDEWDSRLLGGTPGLNGVWMDCTGRAHVNGVDGYGFVLEPGSMEPVIEETPTTMVLHAIFGFDGGPRFGVGGTLDSSPPYTGMVIESGGQ